MSARCLGRGLTDVHEEPAATGIADAVIIHLVVCLGRKGHGPRPLSQPPSPRAQCPLL